MYQIGIHVASGPDASTYTFAYGVFLGLVAPMCVRRKLSPEQRPSQVSIKQDDKIAPTSSQLPRHRKKKQRNLKRLNSNSNQQNPKTHPSSNSSSTEKQHQPKQQSTTLKQPDHRPQQDEPRQEVPDAVQSRPSFYSRADAVRGLVYGATLSGLTSAYFVNQHPSFGFDLIAIAALFGGLLAMTITGIGRFAIWWADHLENRQLGKFGLTLLELGVLLTLIQPLADLLDLVH